MDGNLRAIILCKVQQFESKKLLNTKYKRKREKHGADFSIQKTTNGQFK